MRLRPEERETILRRADADTSWDVYTESPTFQRRLRRLARYGVTCEAVGDYGLRCRIPASWVTLAPPRRDVQPPAGNAAETRQKAR